MNKQIIFFILKMLIIVILPKILTCISASYLLQLVNENKILCSKLPNAINPSICTKKDKENKNEITYIDKYNENQKFYLLNTITINNLKNIAKATIGLAVISIIFTLIANITKFVVVSPKVADIPKALNIFALLMQFITAGLLYSCFYYFMNIFEYYEKKEEYKKIFIATVIIDFVCFFIGVYILFS